TACGQRAYAVGQPGQRGGVVAAVEEAHWPRPARLQPARPARLFQSAGRLAKALRGGDRQRRVGRLVAAQQRYPQARELEAGPGDVDLGTLPSAPAGGQPDLLAEPPEVGAGRGGGRLDHAQRSPLGPGDDRVAGLDDARLLEGDLLNRVTQVPLVVERHVGDDGEAEVEDVGRVEPAAHADLDHQPVATWRQEGEGD